MYKIFLQEGKKEDSIKRVKEMFPDDSDFIDKIFDETAKLGAKYIPFVETETKRFLIDPFTDFDVFISGLIRQIEFFNKNSNKITPEVIGTVKELWDGVESRAFPKLDVVMKSPKDINSYNIDTLGYLTQALSMISSKREKERAAKKEAEKIKFLAESERKSLLATASQELKVQERGLIGLQEAQKEIANQLAQIAQSTLTRIQAWNTPETSVQKEVGQVTKVDVQEKKLAAKPKSVPQAGKSAKPKSTKPLKATSPKKASEKKLSSKDMEIQDDGLPTLNKVLEAYAKSTGPRGKVGDIN